MARLRKFSAYQNLKRPYTRISKYTAKSFVRGGFPHLKITKFDMGTPQKEYDSKVILTSCDSMNVRQNSLEAARMSSNRLLEKTIGADYHLRVKVYPFHVLRENALASGAGADRLSTGMQKAYGKPVGCAARVKEGQALMELRINKANLKLGRDAMVRAAKKFPCRCKIYVAN